MYLFTVQCYDNDQTAQEGVEKFDSLAFSLEVKGVNTNPYFLGILEDTSIGVLNELVIYLPVMLDND